MNTQPKAINNLEGIKDTSWTNLLFVQYCIRIPSLATGVLQLFTTFLQFYAIYLTIESATGSVALNVIRPYLTTIILLSLSYQVAFNESTVKFFLERYYRQLDCFTASATPLYLIVASFVLASASVSLLLALVSFVIVHLFLGGFSTVIGVNNLIGLILLNSVVGSLWGVISAVLLPNIISIFFVILTTLNAIVFLTGGAITNVTYTIAVINPLYHTVNITKHLMYVNSNGDIPAFVINFFKLKEAGICSAEISLLILCLFVIVGLIVLPLCSLYTRQIRA